MRHERVGQERGRRRKRIERSLQTFESIADGYGHLAPIRNLIQWRAREPELEGEGGKCGG